MFSNSKANNTPGNRGVEAKVGENKPGNSYAARTPATRGGLLSNHNIPSPNSEGKQPPSDTNRQGWGRFSR